MRRIALLLVAGLGLSAGCKHVHDDDRRRAASERNERMDKSPPSQAYQDMTDWYSQGFYGPREARK